MNVKARRWDVVDWMYVSQGTDQLRAVVNTAMNQGTEMREIFYCLNNKQLYKKKKSLFCGIIHLVTYLDVSFTKTSLH